MDSIACQTTNTRGIAVVTDTSLLINREGRRVQTVDIEHLDRMYDSLCDLGIAHNLSCLWIVPGSHWSAIAGQLQYTADHYNARIQYEKRSGLPVFVSIERNRGTFDQKRRIFIGLPEHDSRWAEDDPDGWALADVESPTALLGALCYLRELDVDVLFSPGYSGIDLLKKLAKKTKERAAWFDMPALEDVPDYHEVDLLWTRPLTPDERHKKYIYFYDRNGMYLAAATGAECGQGTPIRVGPMDYTGKGCQIWHYRNAERPAFTTLPPVVKHAEGWAVTPVVEAMRNAGYTYELVEGREWEKHTRCYRFFANTLWAARGKLKEPSKDFSNDLARDTAYKMLKIIATRSVGWLDLSSVKREGRKEQWHRPHDKNQIVGLAKFRMFLTMQMMLDTYDAAPCLIYTDCIAYVSSCADPMQAFPELTRRATELGGFKHEMTIEITPEVVGILKNDGQLAAYEVKRALNAIGKKKKKESVQHA